MKKFTKQELKEKLEMTEGEIKLVMESQRKFPEILVEEGEGFCVDGRKLHCQLKVEKAFTTWIKSNLEKVDAFLEEDYTEKWIDKKGDSFKGNLENTSITDLTGLGYKKGILLTLDIAKEIAMVSGASNRANKELKMNSKLCRKYFISMEKAVKKMTKWNKVREPEKSGATGMKHYIADWCDRTGRDKTIENFYTREFNMLNISLTGKSAQQLKSYIGYKDIQTREHLDININRSIGFLQELNISLLLADMDFDKRKSVIETTCKNKYSELYIDDKLKIKSK